MIKSIQFKTDFPYFVIKKWGGETIISGSDSSDEYAGKILDIKHEHEIGFHYNSRPKTLFLLSGNVTITVRDPNTRANTSFKLKYGDTLKIYSGCVHSIFAHTDSKIIELSTKFTQSDTYRV